MYGDVIMKKLLIVVDFQNDFVNGALGFSGAADTETGIVRKINEYRANEDEIVFTYDTHGKDYLETQEGKNLPVPHCIEGTEGHGLYGRVAGLKADEDKVFLKNTFGSGELFEYLKTADRYESIELVGLVSNICVIANGVLAKTAQPETTVIVDTACTASFDEKLHNAALDVMKGLQIEVVG
jgi:nicotinamidase-related amidase